MHALVSGFPILPAALTAITIALWAFSRLPEYLTALLFFGGAMALAAAPREVVFSGFASRRSGWCSAAMCWAWR
ncbi:hypothetical protein WJ968_17400 [Achromobacter xylosoxidans]